ncbi:tellurite resistance/C4-dicarboxylate transporter family protein [Streptomyces sp. NPDC049040]|uniref:tellurite resistance/C4-dicarboxylate transporter family protein n=1 Tax=Streptomyces sp. NPDC049040 TaxID=3365593 RepID=UPI00371BE7F5
MNTPPGRPSAARVLDGLRSAPPGAGAVVMATGIISVGMRRLGHPVLSGITLVLAAVVWAVLAAAFAVRLGLDRAGWQMVAASPPGLTAIAASCVLGTRLSLLGWQTVAGILLALSAVVCPWLLVSVLRHWKGPAPGVVFLVCVAAESLAVLAITIALAEDSDWLAWAALVCCAAGIPLYAQALCRFDFREITAGAGDQWIAGGALAITALTASKLAASPVWTGGAHSALRTGTFVLLALDLAWCAVLAAAEVARPRPRYDLRRWSTVFPLGMTAVAALSTSDVTGARWPHGIGTVLLWVAVAAWLLTAAGSAAAANRRARR